MESPSSSEMQEIRFSAQPGSSILYRQVTRRFLMRRALLGVGATAAAGLLAACGGDDSEAPAPTTGSAGAGAGASTSTSGSTGSGTGSGAATQTTAQTANIPTGGTLIYAVTREPTRLDPTQDSLAPSQMIHFSIHDCLVGRAPDNQYHPWLAKSWEVAPDGTSYTFKLNEGVKFHDGTAFNAAAVKYMMDRVHNPDSKTRISPGAYGFYVQTDTPDDLTAVIKLNKPWAPLLDAFSYIYRVVSPTAGEKHGEALAQNPVGTGPFMFKEWIPNDHVTLVRNPDYKWASTMFKHQGPAYVDQIIFKQIPEAGTRVAALENGEAHIIEVLPPQDAQRISTDKKYKVLVGRVPGRPYCYTINMRKPPTNELEVRQAMWYGTNQEAICQTVFGPLQPLGAFAPAHGMLVPVTWGYSKDAEIYKYDPDKAKKTLDDAGWKVGPGGIRQKNGQNLEITLATWEHGAAEVVQAQLREIGIDYKIEVLAPVATNEAARREQVHMSPLPAARSDPDVLGLNHSRSRETGVEFTFHSNAHLDDLYDQGASATTDAQRLEIYKEVQMIMMKDAMQLSLYDRDNVSAARAEVGGDIIFDRGFFPLLYDLYIKK